MPGTSFSSSTSISLIRRVREHDSDAWAALSRLYGPLVYRWARQAGVTPEDSADIVQNVFVSVFRGIGGFSKEGGGSFRGWLWTITRNSTREMYRRRGGAPVAAGGSDAHRRLREHPDFLDRESEPDDPNPEPGLAQRALHLIRESIDERSWEAFRRTALADEAAVDVAAELGMTPRAVRQAKYRVLCRLRATDGV
jgi:RNA polymerase sigma-70 factor (ECF subfamily)